MTKYFDKKVRVKLTGGREVEGIVKGYDAIQNLVIDEAIEYLRGASLSNASVARFWCSSCTVADAFCGRSHGPQCGDHRNKISGLGCLSWTPNYLNSSN